MMVMLEQAVRSMEKTGMRTTTARILPTRAAPRAGGGNPWNLM
jgi:hypothetical protein